MRWCVDCFLVQSSCVWSQRFSSDIVPEKKRGRGNTIVEETFQESLMPHCESDVASFTQFSRTRRAPSSIGHDGGGNYFARLANHRCKSTLHTKSSSSHLHTMPVNHKPHRYKTHVLPKVGQHPGTCPSWPSSLFPRTSRCRQPSETWRAQRRLDTLTGRKGED